MRKNTMISLVDTFLYLWIWLKNQGHKGEYVKKKKQLWTTQRMAIHSKIIHRMIIYQGFNLLHNNSLQNILFNI